jgi:hypothetical protein
VRMSFSPVIILALVLFISACTPQPTAVPFIPPSDQTQVATEPVAVYSPPPLPTTVANSPVPTNIPSPASNLCINNLRFVEDVSYPDGTVVRPGERIEKVWKVENNGTCAWDSKYRMRLVSGDQLGAPAELALYPARPGTQAELRIIFIAPLENRQYQSTWQAYDPNGNIFGDPFYINIIVQSP